MRLLSSYTLSHTQSDFVLVFLLRALAILASGIVILIFAFVLMEALPVFSEIGIARFFNDPSWHPVEHLYNLLPMFWGTIIVMSSAILIAAPLGILSGIYCSFYGSTNCVWFYRRIIELLAGLPSVVYGFWGLMVLVPFIVKINPPGTSLLAGIIILVIMILPTMALSADVAFSNISSSYLQGAGALGYSKLGTVLWIAIPAARSTLITGFMMQIGRAIGETMALLMVCGNVVQIPKSVFDPIRTLAVNIALEMAYATGNHRSSLFVSGVILIILVTALVGIASLLERRGNEI